MDAIIQHLSRNDAPQSVNQIAHALGTYYQRVYQTLRRGPFVSSLINGQVWWSLRSSLQANLDRAADESLPIAAAG